VVYMRENAKVYVVYRMCWLQMWDTGRLCGVCVNCGGLKFRVGMYRICGTVAWIMCFVSSSNVLVVGCAVVSLSFMRVRFEACVVDIDSKEAGLSQNPIFHQIE